jgi:hypothetical protein
VSHPDDLEAGQARRGLTLRCGACDVGIALEDSLAVAAAQIATFVDVHRRGGRFAITIPMVGRPATETVASGPIRR